jgi:hypothetical protein
MPRIQPTPGPYASTTIALQPPEQYLTAAGYTVSAILVTPATRESAAFAASPVAFQEFSPEAIPAAPARTISDIHTLPPQLRTLVLQICSEYQRTGPEQPVPALSPQAEKVRSGRSGGSKLGRRLGKGHWSS